MASSMLVTFKSYDVSLSAAYLAMAGRFSGTTRSVRLTKIASPPGPFVAGFISQLSAALYYSHAAKQ